MTYNATTAVGINMTGTFSLTAGTTSSASVVCLPKWQGAVFTQRYHDSSLYTHFNIVIVPTDFNTN
jgi:hypothetical protein